MAAKVRFLTEKSTETPPTEQTLNHFWMQFIEYLPKEYFKPLKCYVGNPRWGQNIKWRPKPEKAYFYCQMANFQRISKNFRAFYLSN
jgi:hypothetical protein